MINYPESHAVKSFTGLSVQQFDEVYREIESKYSNHEIKRLSSPKRERDVGAVRRFKLAVKNRIIMVLVLKALHNLYPDGVPLWFGSE